MCYRIVLGGWVVYILYYLNLSKVMIWYFYILFVFFFVVFSSCIYIEKVRDGQIVIEVKQYVVVFEFFQKEYEKFKSCVEKGCIVFKIGEVYKNFNQSDFVICWYKIVYDNQYGWEFLCEYVFVLK